jgi:hypothetical protein
MPDKQPLAATVLAHREAETLSLTPPAGGSAPAGLDPTALDPLSSPVLQQELPGVLDAFNAQVMGAYLQEALFGPASARYTIRRCKPGKATYLAGECCILRYELEVGDSVSGEILRPLVSGRVFPDPDSCARYLRERLAPLAARMQDRPEIAPFSTPIAAIAPLHMVVYVFPIDGELPTLVEATDPRHMVPVFRETLPDAVAGTFAVASCRVEPGHYGRQHRCVLRYHVTGAAAGAEREERLIYGKVAADGRGAVSEAAVVALRARLAEQGAAPRFTIPQPLGFRPDLQLALLEAIPGVPQIAQLLAARLRGEPAPPASLTLEEMIDACARIAAALHSSQIELGPRRELADELAGLRAGFAHVRRISPALGARLEDWLARVEAAARQSPPLPLCFSHGDFTYTQLIFDGAATGLVDFDTICRAEPALDLGQFLAYLRVAALKAQKAAAVPSRTLAEPLAAQFQQTYRAALDPALAGATHLPDRVAVYEIISLLRMALHSWQKLKGVRLEHVITLLEERTSCLPRSND